ncbi:MAG: molecular chaperone DnaK [Candidatus Magasanikbacteria bacterium CG11_big_fil_rev_8_21_14_0_20_39_34]|uniref:Molecular chaperone DnaK n=1 Tax=Candidatus Magasanikbacteria bacterium CG11_big_fil_rev_8_21_14_0_20_39_34 TaxID=1974653 RepID=A0A2H0N6R8_9BACT|nr:MAG: molecular chaperone DnaK [Candidatus Magasanikbacteria bacterium CG11_big_fil_rev_8_21_14_0_20_39_34]
MAKTLDFFDQAFIDEIQKMLEDEEQRLEKELENMQGHVEYGDTEEDNAHEVIEDEVNRQLIDRLEKTLRDVKSALQRIHNGTYGICKYTGEPISKERLRARPTSSSSVEAKKVLTDES